MRRFFTMLGLVAVTAAAATAVAEPDLDAFAKRLAELRAEVESLSTRVEEAKITRRNEQRSVAAQKADLEFQLQREERRLAQLRAQAEKRREQVAAAGEDDAELTPAVDAAMDLLRRRIETGLPFKTAERLGALEALDAQLAQGLIPAPKAAVQLWALVEDELRLGRENGLYRQVITLDGEEVLVDIARLGMVAAYFRTDDGRFGHVVRDGDAWVWRLDSDESARRQIAGLFDAMRKQIRTGYFELPGDFGGAR